MRFWRRMRVGRASSGIPRSGSSNGFATSTAMPAGLPSSRTTCGRNDCGITRCCATAARSWPCAGGFWRSAGRDRRGRAQDPLLCDGPAAQRRLFCASLSGETAEAFCDGHNAAFAFFGKVPRSILYDNTKLAVARILGDGMRQRTRVFSELQSHYVFADRFGRPGKGNDKGKVEGLIGWIRRNLLVPVPRAVTLTALNEQLLEGCRRRLGDR